MSETLNNRQIGAEAERLYSEHKQAHIQKKVAESLMAGIVKPDDPRLLMNKLPFERKSTFQKRMAEDLDIVRNARMAEVDQAENLMQSNGEQATAFAHDYAAQLHDMAVSEAHNNHVVINIQQPSHDAESITVHHG